MQEKQIRHPHSKKYRVIMQILLVVVASLLLQGTGFAKEKGPPCNPKSKNCKVEDTSGIAFIAFNEIGQLGPMEDSIKSARTLLWPNPQPIIFHYLDFGELDIDALANQVETLVEQLKADGYRRIGLPALSLFLAPYIRGDAGALGGVNIQDRHPDVVFAAINPGTPAVEEASNVFRFLDVETGFGFDNLQASVAKLVEVGGEMLIIYEEGDALAESIRNDFIDAAVSLAIPYNTVAVPFEGFEFNASSMQAAATSIQGLPVGSLVVHSPNGVHSEEYAVAGNTAGIFISTNSTSHFGGNFYPNYTTIPVDLELGITTRSGPSLEMEQLGFPITIEDWSLETRATLYIEAYGWFANAGNFVGVHDHHLQFDSGGTRIAYEIADGYIPADSTNYSQKNRRTNPRWHTDRSPLDWSAVFGD